MTLLPLHHLGSHTTETQELNTSPHPSPSQRLGFTKYRFTAHITLSVLSYRLVYGPVTIYSLLLRVRILVDRSDPVTLLLSLSHLIQLIRPAIPPQDVSLTYHTCCSRSTELASLDMCILAPSFLLASTQRSLVLVTLSVTPPTPCTPSSSFPASSSSTSR